MSEKSDVAKELERMKAENEALQKEKAEAEARIREIEEAAKARTAELEAMVSMQEEKIFRQIAQQKKARIVIPSGRSEHERCPVPIGLNGREFLIERDREVDVPVGVLNVLNLAQARIARTSGDGPETVTSFHNAPRYPYRLVGYIDPRAIIL